MTASKYTDYAGNNLLWLNLNPGPTNGQIVCNVQWKTNAPNSNPGITALSFTNSTSVGTWSLVFTDPTHGYVVAPGQVILGTTNFTIADADVATDFANPLQAVFGIQPNSTAGQGPCAHGSGVGEGERGNARIRVGCIGLPLDVAHDLAVGGSRIQIQPKQVVTSVIGILTDVAARRQFEMQLLDGRIIALE